MLLVVSLVCCHESVLHMLRLCFRLELLCTHIVDDRPRAAEAQQQRRPTQAQQRAGRRVATRSRQQYHHAAVR